MKKNLRFVVWNFVHQQLRKKTLSSCCVFWEMTSYPVTYCWWKKSCTTQHVWHPVNNGIFTISTGAGFLPPTVVVIINHKIRIPVMNQSGFHGVHVLLPRCSVIPTISGICFRWFFYGLYHGKLPSYFLPSILNKQNVQVVHPVPSLNQGLTLRK